MLPTALTKLWKKTQGSVPRLSAREYEWICDVSPHYYDIRTQIKMWGVIDEKYRYKNENFLHCFNFGTTGITFPWSAEVINFGRRYPVVITKSGTVRLKKTFRTLIHQIETPFLAFGYTGEAALEDYLQPGALIVQPGSGFLMQEIDVVFPEGTNLSGGNGVLFYFMQKRISFEAEYLGLKPLPGETFGLPHYTLKLSDAMAFEPGWPVLVLAGNEWVWGVVTQ